MTSGRTQHNHFPAICQHVNVSTLMPHSNLTCLTTQPLSVEVDFLRPPDSGTPRTHCGALSNSDLIPPTNPKSHNTVPQGNPAYVNSPCPLRKQARWLACQIVRERWLRKINKHYYWNKKDDCKVEVTQFPHGLCKQIRVRVGLRKLDKRCRLSYFDTQSET